MSEDSVVEINWVLQFSPIRLLHIASLCFLIKRWSQESKEGVLYGD